MRLNTDGLANLVHKRNVLPEMTGLIDAMSISLNAQNEEVYNRHCVPALDHSWQAMLDFLQQAPAYIPEVTATAINGLDGVDIEACRRLAEERGARFRQRQLDRWVGIVDRQEVFIETIFRICRVIRSTSDNKKAACRGGFFNNSDQVEDYFRPCM